eukprot:4188516-Alexandrium_andersonii.AAC.1
MAAAAAAAQADKERRGRQFVCDDPDTGELASARKERCSDFAPAIPAAPGFSGRRGEAQSAVCAAGIFQRDTPTWLGQLETKGRAGYLFRGTSSASPYTLAASLAVAAESRRALPARSGERG